MSDKYADLSTEEFDRLLREVIDAESLTASELLTIPGVYEIVSEHYNNAVLERWEEEQAEQEDEEDEEDEDTEEEQP